MSIAVTAVPTGTYTIDPAHSRVEFAVRHLGIATVRGHFSGFEGTLELAEDPSASRAFGSIEVASVDTQEPQRDEHLRSADFFDAERFPQITFDSNQIRRRDEDSLEIDGELTLHGVTRAITLDVELQGTETDPWGNERIGLEARGQLSRSDYGMTFNQVLGSGNVLVSDRVKLIIEISAVKQG
jgi:polyisoprenoid-binding protein YceI